MSEEPRSPRPPPLRRRRGLGFNGGGRGTERGRQEKRPREGGKGGGTPLWARSSWELLLLLLPPLEGPKWGSPRSPARLPPCRLSLFLLLLLLAFKRLQHSPSVLLLSPRPPHAAFLLLLLDDINSGNAVYYDGCCCQSHNHEKGAIRKESNGHCVEVIWSWIDKAPEDQQQQQQQNHDSWPPSRLCLSCPMLRRNRDQPPQETSATSGCIDTGEITQFDTTFTALVQGYVILGVGACCGALLCSALAPTTNSNS
ncbi:uncharacterized protein LOC121925289 [Sceloporus undulatus]|uniref:uncharacterized protein LOC121925289 n=1 Tax=Sceloporus undulatus TaxID=8520 RepID=UPI001C4ACD53|nr:uncharacterized protein LOC121925289 [Sceloporus undulatus]